MQPKRTTKVKEGVKQSGVKEVKEVAFKHQKNRGSNFFLLSPPLAKYRYSLLLSLFHPYPYMCVAGARTREAACKRGERRKKPLGTSRPDFFGEARGNSRAIEHSLFCLSEKSPRSFL